jgi:hypothetical protein
MHEIPVFIYGSLFLIYFLGSTTISCGIRVSATNAYFLGKDVLEAEKCTLLG